MDPLPLLIARKEAEQESASQALQRVIAAESLAASSVQRAEERLAATKADHSSCVAALRAPALSAEECILHEIREEQAAAQLLSAAAHLKAAQVALEQAKQVVSTARIALVQAHDALATLRRRRDEGESERLQRRERKLADEADDLALARRRE